MAESDEMSDVQFAGQTPTINGKVRNARRISHGDRVDGRGTMQMNGVVGPV